MTVFWLVAALFIAGALLMLLPPLWSGGAPGVATARANLVLHRDQWRELHTDLAAGLLTPERFEQAKAELERRVLDDVAAAPAVAAGPARRTALGLALGLPLAVVALYVALGRPQATDPAPMPSERHATSPAQLAQMATALVQRLQAEPKNAEGWFMLGRSYTMLGRYRDATLAFQRVAELVPGNANLLADLADVAAMAQGKRFSGEPARWIQAALDADPRHAKALSLAGSAAFEARDFAAARGYWQRALDTLPADAPMTRQLRANIAEAGALDGGPPAAAAPTLAGEVVVSPALAAQVPAGATLFVFARASEGSRMPLAVLRRAAGAWPAAFVLDDSMAMAPNLKLSGQAQVVVGARLSLSGSATPQSGDLVGQSAVVAPGVQGLRVVIDRVQP